MRFKTGLILIIFGLFVAIVASPVLAAGYNYVDTIGDPVAVIGKDELLITNGELLTGESLIEGLGLKVVDANGNDLGLPEELVFGFGEDKHSANEEAEIINNFFIDKDYENGGIYVYVSFNEASQYYSGFRTSVTNVDHSNTIYPDEDPYRDVVCAIIGRPTLYIPYGTQITGDMILDNMKVVDSNGNDLGLSEKIVFTKTIGIGNTFEVTADDLAEYINELFDGTPTLLDSYGLNNFGIYLAGPATYFDFRFNVVCYEDKDFVAGEPYMIVGDGSTLAIPLDQNSDLILNRDVLFGGLKVVDINGNDLGMSDQLTFYYDGVEGVIEELKEKYAEHGKFDTNLTVVLEDQLPVIQYNLNVVDGVLADEPGDTEEDTDDDSGSIEGNVAYTTHVQNVGWQDYVADGAMSGTSGQGLRLEGIKIRSGVEGLGIQYATHVENIGWQSFVSDGSLSGTSGQGLRLEAIRIQLTGEQADNYDVYYRVHAQNVGWMGWASNGAEAGTAGYGYRLEGIEIKLVEKGAAAPGSTENAFIDAGDSSADDSENEDGTYTVKYYVDGNLYSQETVAQGDTLTAIADPVSETCYFDDWYTSSSYTTKQAFGGSINGDVSVYGQFMDEYFSLSELFPDEAMAESVRQGCNGVDSIYTEKVNKKKLDAITVLSNYVSHIPQDSEFLQIADFTGISYLQNLTAIDISSDDALTENSFTDEISKIPSFVGINIFYCTNFKELPEAFYTDPYLEVMHIENETGYENSDLSYDSSNSTYIDTDRLFKTNSNWRVVMLQNCRLSGLPDELDESSNLSVLMLEFCTGVSELPESIGNLENLSWLQVYCNDLEVIPESIGNLKNLDNLGFATSSKLTRIPESIGNLSTVTVLHIFNCENLTTLPDSMGNLNIHEMTLANLGLTSMPDITNMMSLIYLNISGNHFTNPLPDYDSILTNLASPVLY
ncbi:MAG: hypothetical protein PWR12_1212 [Eubacteriaceae bacterium]|nr:hypothetical protein [Eubacteriaceae bacterium]MDK2905136.1 hypothetical protein [Eubacteriaceae bacterium]MDK2937498.1 hypothetical protein [Eubacteriaceae bacterium]MDK2961378.1 hypothetical protein [Eubacteriaceae bacterium]